MPEASPSTFDSTDPKRVSPRQGGDHMQAPAGADPRPGPGTRSVDRNPIASPVTPPLEGVPHAGPHGGETRLGSPRDHTPKIMPNKVRPDLAPKQVSKYDGKTDNPLR